MRHDLYFRRFRHFGVSVIRLVEALPRSLASDVVARQLVRSATWVGANYRAAYRARSRAEFIAKLGIVEEEADESMHWMDVLTDLDLLAPRSPLYTEADALLRIVVATRKTARTSENPPRMTHASTPRRTSHVARRTS
jgi:four helix bundle protein